MTSVPPALERWRLQWQHRPRHERRIILALAALVVVGLLWLWLWLPLTQHLQRMQRELPLAQAQLEQAQRQLSESVGLNRQTETPATADARAAVQRVAARFNAASAIVALDVQQNAAQQNTVSLTFSAIPFDTLVQWLDAMQREEHFYVTTASLTPLTGSADKRAEGKSSGKASGQASGLLRVELVLARP
ncbi:MAG: type II secretion system protein M [Burkholderiales bacterium]|jgi:type II secretory pathway component PulM|nr:type II secretion system protein M [Burkholderiales bacterium]